ncbi:hypothetical protein QOZ92_001026 [Paeniclostridium ghonii]|uniref:Uncharacterized protein n=1 Tax=Paraclostridium ghonii TaxID=29358 RepID=A0ABU0MYC6_9FIRM|nr:hypothetical protein [Paeniclostridium ghonii]
MSFFEHRFIFEYKLEEKEDIAHKKEMEMFW